MTSKGILRFFIAAVLVFIVCSIVLPIIGIPKNQLLPPPIVYSSAAHSTATGYVTEKKVAPSPNIFKAGDTIDLVAYKFRGPAIPGYGKPVTPGETVVYTGRARCTSDYYEKTVVGQNVTVRFDPTFPKINGISAEGAGMSGEGSGALLGIWIFFDIAILVVAYFVAMLLERIMLRESY